MKKIYEIGHDDVSQMPRTLAYLQLIFLEVENKLAEIMKISNIHEDREALTPAQIDNYRRWIIDIYVSNYYMCKNHAEILASVLSLSQRQTLRIVNNRNRQIKPREEQNQNHRFNRWFAPPL